MTPEKIKISEDSFAKTLTDSSGKRFIVDGNDDIGGATISRISTQYSSFYYQNRYRKTQVVLHFTAGTIKGDISTLTKENSHVSVAYVVDRQGRIYNLFDDTYWSFHLGGSAIGGNQNLSKQSVAIEISSYGPLVKKPGGYYDTYGNLFCSDGSQVADVTYRGYSHYVEMPQEQVDAVCRLLHHICGKHAIPDTFKENMGTVFASPIKAESFEGIYCHSDVRKDKFDWPPEMANRIRDRYLELYRTVEPEPELPEQPGEETPAEPEPKDAVTEIPNENVVPAESTVDRKTTVEQTRPKLKQSKAGGLTTLIGKLLRILVKR